MSKSTRSLKNQVLNTAMSNKCRSKAGSNISALFNALKVKESGDLSVLHHHMNTQRRMKEKNKASEDYIKEEGRLKIIKSDMKSINENRNCRKDLRNVAKHMKEHEIRVSRGINDLEINDPKAASKLKIASLLPVTDHISSFKSPTRAQLQDYESKETMNRPGATKY